jgi:hypothetical protein
MTLKFNFPQLVSLLEKLSTRARSAFAAACAERLAPGYARFSARNGRGDPDMLEDALRDLWDDLEGQNVAEPILQRHVDTGLLFIKKNQDIKDWLYAEDAIASTVYAIQSRLTGNVKEAAWTAKCATDLLDAHIVIEFDVDFADPGSESRIVADPLMQAELRRQHRDLMELTPVREKDAHGSALIAIVHTRASDDALRFFDRDAMPKS